MSYIDFVEIDVSKLILKQHKPSVGARPAARKAHRQPLFKASLAGYLRPLTVDGFFSCPLGGRDGLAAASPYAVAVQGPDNNGFLRKYLPWMPDAGPTAAAANRLYKQSPIPTV